jgi:hypothetical protein
MHKEHIITKLLHHYIGMIPKVPAHIMVHLLSVCLVVWACVIEL